eukprot:GHVU01085930.1.p1 GENE.GHVU01085930.1~~GHVU01085930.1.p1  ORF type:complete len:160 (+),score=31.98 GHVU01085930.1:121-600(+)
MSLIRLSRVCRFAADAAKNRLLLTLASPSEAVYVRKPIDSVTLPGTEGTFTVTNSHSQTVTQLKPGVVTVRLGGTDDTKQFFMTDGFLIYKSPSDPAANCCTAEVSAVELAPLEALDKEKAAQVMAEVLSGPKETTWDKARIVLGQELCSTMIRAAPQQ